MREFRRIVLAALTSGVVAGLLLFAVQQWQVIPLLQQSETSAQAAGAGDVSPAPEQITEGRRVIVLDGAQPVIESLREHEHDHDEPHDHAEGHAHGGQGSVATLVANILIGTGFGLLLAGLMSMHGSGGIVAGLAWGVAGFLVFFLVPALGLPPRLPGSAAAPLFERQAWWWLAASCAAVALTLLLLQKKWLLRLAGMAILVLPFVAGTPRINDSGATTLLPDIFGEFFQATFIANLLFWLSLGLICALMLGRRGSSDDTILL